MVRPDVVVDPSPRAGQAPLAFGPVPSRRLGRSLGVNNIPPKICSYGCVYCQVGATPSPQLEPRPVYEPGDVAIAVRDHVARVRARGELIDHLTFAPDGEPTLDADLGRAIAMLRPLQIPIAVISNGSLAWRPEVREALRGADWVSVKVDAVDERVWRQVDRPADALRLGTVLEGIRVLADRFPAQLVSETMLVQGLNDDDASLRCVARFLEDAGISTAYLSIPTRPPTERWVGCPAEDVVARAYGILAERVPTVEYLIGYEGDAFSASGDARADLLSITAVHPLRRSAVGALLERCGADWQVVRDLVREGRLIAVEHAGDSFFVRRFQERRAS